MSDAHTCHDRCPRPGCVARREMEKTIAKLTDDRDKAYAGIARQSKEIANLKSIIAKEVSENDEFGSEFVLVWVLKAELETARRVREKLTEQRNYLLATVHQRVPNLPRTRLDDLDLLNAEIAALQNAPKILEDTGGGSGRMEILEVHGDEKDGTK